MNKALLDTDILSFYLRGNDKVIQRITGYLKEFPTITISEITYYEILAGLEYKEANAQIDSFERFASQCEIVSISKESLQQSAKIYGSLRRKGVTIGTADLLICGLAITYNLQLITHNIKHYQGVEALVYDDWMA